MIALDTDVLVRYLVDDDAARLENAILLAEEGPAPDRGAGE